LNEGAVARLRVERGGTPLSDFIGVRSDGQSRLSGHKRTGRARIHPCQERRTRPAH